ncbi:Uncharacterised protein [Klebsiella pneumoniae]|nr:hypothetical protein AN412_26180 [Klebsiella pneumoniae]KTS15498.1 hypothetical protein NS215_16685 [Pantoea dispersa]OVU99615.1 hypothetical protein BME05_15005 [Klebsiella quasipneumoniae subsp. quasipneumoniae]BBV32537.1 hypothetical protein STW0522CIT01_40260 [Citrobacter freundii]KTS86094.1 hypothetical protein RSA31_19780 [Pantoea dispersa]
MLTVVMMQSMKVWLLFFVPMFHVTTPKPYSFLTVMFCSAYTPLSLSAVTILQDIQDGTLF